MIKRSTLFSLVTLIFLLACTQSNYKIAESLYNNKKYAAAIEYYDQFINKSKNGATKTMAEISRNQCYHELGLAAFNVDDFQLAARFFYLANTPESDTYLDDCYFQLSLQAAGDTERILTYYRTIIDEIPNSDLAPQLLYQSIEIEVNQLGNKEKGWADYKMLVHRFPDNEYCKKAQAVIDTFILEFIESADKLKSLVGYQPALDQLFVIAEYPTMYQQSVYKRISNIYLEYGEYYIKQREFIKAEETFKAAVDYDATKSKYVNNRLQEICMLFIEKGDEFLAKRDIKNAIIRYTKAFDIIPGLEKAENSIANAKQLEKNIKSAKHLSKEAEKLEYKKDYASALKVYKQAYALDALQVYSDKIELNTNLVKAETNPIPFARSILFKYKNGLIPNKVYEIETALKQKYGDETRTSGWRFLISIGQYQYEARYDISTPEETRFFVWQVDLKNKSIVPLNKASEEITK
jgi:tetratricopeptide (TPR) repeat protein